MFGYQRSKNTYTPGSVTPFKLSRSKIELFERCPRCFYLDRRYGIGQPPPAPYTLNSAVDGLLKKEFDAHRAAATRHPLQEHYGIDAVPYDHQDIGSWRENFEGVRTHHRPTNFIVFGAVDDVWQNTGGELHVVDYKATAKDSEINLDADWQIGYKRQVEIYQWLLRQNGHSVSDTAYFVYVNGRKDKQAFDGKLEFDVHLLPYQGSADWVEGALARIKKLLENDALPDSSPQCEYCQYSLYRRQAEG